MNKNLSAGYQDRPLPGALRMITWVVIASQVVVPFTPNIEAALSQRTAMLLVHAQMQSAGTTALTTVMASTANRTTPTVERPALRPSFSENPTDAEITRARVFGEPLIRMSKASTAEENKALGVALMSFVDRSSNEDLAGLLTFLEQYPQSSWRASLLLNLGIVYRRTGYFLKALVAWDEAWRLSKAEAAEPAKAVGDLAIGELLELNARLGRYETLEALFSEIEGRDVRGPATEKISGARYGLFTMRNRPEVAFRCGPMALDRILAAANPADAFNIKIKESRSGTNGMSLVEVLALANELNMGYRMAKRARGSTVITPAVVHWKAGHYAALTREEDGKFLIQDPTFGEDIWITRRALEEESSGYFLVPQASLASGWQAVTEAEGQTVWGKGLPSGSAVQRTKPYDKKTKCPGTPGMAQYSFHLMLASLNIVDTPVGYAPPRGRPIPFTVTYNQREANQPSTFTYSNLGKKWNFNWLSYILDDPALTNGTKECYLPGGGAEVYNVYDTTLKLFRTRSEDRGHLVRTSNSSYERRLPDGSREIFDVPDGASTYPRKVFLTQMIDPAGNVVSNTFDADLRLVAITDAIGLVTTISYGSTNDTDNLYYKITSVTDPFGRSATFQYNASFQLTNITDVVGINSSFTYGTGDFINSLTTPYGTTTFAMGEPSGKRWLEAVDPLGQKEHVRYQDDSVLPPTEPVAPTGFSNSNLRYRNSFYWDKKAVQLHGTNDITKAVIYHWLHTYSLNESSGILESEKQPLENRVGYLYYGQSQPAYEGTNGIPKSIGRVLDDGTDQITTFEYNDHGRVTKVTDPAGRQTRFTYETNLVDLLEVRQVVGSTNELLAKFTYSTNHLPLTSVDATGKTNWFTYNSYGQLTAITNALSEVVTMSYNSNGYLTNITGAIAGATTSFSYDGTNRVQSVTDSEGYTVSFEYDALDRPTKITYPDSTYEQIVYQHLDPILHRDRRGHWTQTIYDPLRQVVAVQDALNRVTRFDWCSCGALGSLTDPLGRVTTWMRDLQGRVTEKIYPDLSTVTYTYEDATSRLKEITDAKGQKTQHAYNIDDNLASVVYTNSTVITPTVTFTYHSNYNRIETMVDGIGTNTYAYYAVSNTVLGAGQLKSIDGPFANDMITYVYDELGRAKSRDINSAAERATYDALGRVTTLTNVLGSFTHAYVNQTFRLSSVTYPNSQTTTFSYFGNTNDQRLESIWHKTSGAATISKFDYTYDADGQIKTWTQQADSGTAKVSVFDYDSADQLVGTTVRSGGITGAVLRRYAYGYDKGGNRTGEQIDLGVSSATHNNLNQLTSVSASAGPVKFAGRLSETGIVYVANSLATMGNPSTSFVAYATLSTGTPQVELKAMDYALNWVTNTYEVTLTNNGLAKALTYDLNGNLTEYSTSTVTNKYEWDAADRLVKISRRPAGGQWNVTQFSYDGLGRRVRLSETTNNSTTTKSFTWCDTELCEERNSTGGTVNRRFFGQGEQISGTEYVFTRDHLGSVREMISSGGTIQARYEFDPYGRRTKVSGSSESDFAYTGHYYHQKSGLHLAPYREYDPEAGRWLKRDPIVESGGVNLYAYVGGDPINGTDLLGLSKEDGLDWHHNAVRKYELQFQLSGINIHHKRWGTKLPPIVHRELIPRGFSDKVEIHLFPDGEFVPTSPSKYAKFLKNLKNDPDFADLFKYGKVPPNNYLKLLIGGTFASGLLSAANAQATANRVCVDTVMFAHDRHNGLDDWAYVAALDARHALNQQAMFSGDVYMRGLMR